VTITLPNLLLREVDVFLSLPVPKVHVMTGVSLGFKNQWGCIPSTYRLKDHPAFDLKIVAINRRLNPRVIMDGTYFLDGAGPLTGEPVRTNLILAGDSAGAADSICCQVMRIQTFSIPHLRLARQEGLLPDAVSEIDVNHPVEIFSSRRFVSRRALIDWISLLGFRSRIATWLFWFSPLARALHMGLQAATSIPWLEKCIYGKAGSPPPVKSLSKTA
jgi:uncharacterized protein (DUF362 family)